MANEKDMNWGRWLTCLLAIVVMVLSVLILVKVNKKCEKSGYAPPSRNSKLRARLGKLRTNNPAIISSMSQKYCGDDSQVANYTNIDTATNSCNVGLFDDPDDSVMQYLCNYVTTDDNGNQVNVKQMLQKNYPDDAKVIDCIVNNQYQNDPSECCGGSQNSYGGWN